MSERTVVSHSDVFINVPFDPQHEKLFLALLSGLVGLGLNPRCVLEVPATTDRLRRIYKLVRKTASHTSGGCSNAFRIACTNR